MFFGVTLMYTVAIATLAAPQLGFLSASLAAIWLHRYMRQAAARRRIHAAVAGHMEGQAAIKVARAVRG